MKSVLVLGGGRVGKSVAELLLGCGRGAYKVTLADHDEANLRTAEQNLRRLKDFLSEPPQFAFKKSDASSASAIRETLKGHDYVICMLPFNLVQPVAAAAFDLGVHYFDVTEDVHSTEAISALCQSGRARCALVPQCGLAPGYIAIAAHDVARGFDRIHDLTLRVGALPQFPTNALKYNSTWSTAGLVNEYCEPCNVMLDGAIVKAPALEGLEAFALEGIDYEAFYTSGGVGSLIETLIGEKKTGPDTKVAYKTIRYPGHRDLMKFLLQDLRLGEKAVAAPAPPGGRVFDRTLLMALLDHAVPRTIQDVVVIFVNCIGMKHGRLEQVNLRRLIRAKEMFGRTWPAIELTTAAGVCAMLDLHRLGRLPQTGLIRQEECTLAMLSETPLAAVYEDEESSRRAAESAGV